MATKEIEMPLQPAKAFNFDYSERSHLCTALKLNIAKVKRDIAAEPLQEIRDLRGAHVSLLEALLVKLS